MAGEMMEVVLDADCVANCAPHIAAKLPAVTRRLCKSLSIPGVARFFIHQVRIGDTVALVDRNAGHTFRIRMEAHSVRVLEVYENGWRPEGDTPAVYLVNWGLLRPVVGQKAVAA